MAEARYDLPLVEDDTRPWWDAVRTGRLLLETCSACAHVQFPVRGYCSRCWCEDIALTESTGRGTVYTYSTVRANALPPFNSRLPYNVAMVDLDDGPRLMTTILTGAAVRVKAGAVSGTG